LEGQIVRLCDKISYIHHDMDDAIRAGILNENDVPHDLRDLLGHSTRERLNTFVHDIVNTSSGMGKVEMSPAIGEAMKDLRKFMFENLYTNAAAKGEENKAELMVRELYGYYISYPDKMPADYYRMIEEKGEAPERVVCDYISGMTDQYSMMKFREIFIPKSWSKL
jgi:dGTPase